MACKDVANEEKELAVFTGSMEDEFTRSARYNTGSNRGSRRIPIPTSPRWPNVMVHQVILLRNAIVSDAAPCGSGPVAPRLDYTFSA